VSNPGWAGTSRQSRATEALSDRLVPAREADGRQRYSGSNAVRVPGDGLGVVESTAKLQMVEAGSAKPVECRTSSRPRVRGTFRCRAQSAGSACAGGASRPRCCRLGAGQTHTDRYSRAMASAQFGLGALTPGLFPPHSQPRWGGCPGRRVANHRCGEQWTVNPGSLDPCVPSPVDVVRHLCHVLLPVAYCTRPAGR